MEQQNVCIKLNGLNISPCECGQGSTVPTGTAGPRVLRAYFDKAGTYDWTAPDLAEGAPYLAQIRLKGAGAGGESAMRSGNTYSGNGGGEGCLVEFEVTFVPGQTFHLTVGMGGKGGALSSQSGYSGNVNPVSGKAGQDTVFDELCSAPGAQNQAGGSRQPVEGSSEIVTPGQPGGARTACYNTRSAISGQPGGGQGGGVADVSNGIHGGGGAGGSGVYGASDTAAKFTAGTNGGDGFIAIYTR